MFKDKKRIICIFTLVFALLLHSFPVYAAAPKIEDIPNRTLIIGVYLIELEAMSKEISDLAKNSSSSSQQMKVYYKSEFANGTWFDITDGKSLEAVMADKGKVISNQDITALLPKLKYWVHSGGKIEDLQNNKNISLRDLHKGDQFPNLDPSDFTELKRLNAEKAIAENLDSTREKNYRCDAIDRLLQPLTYPGNANILKNMDNLDAFTTYMQQQNSDNKDELLEILNGIREKAENTRLVEAYKELSSRVKSEANAAKDGSHQEFSGTLFEIFGQLEQKLAELDKPSQPGASGILEKEKQESLSNAEKSANNGSSSFAAAAKELDKAQTLDAIANDRVTDTNKASALLKASKEKAIKDCFEKLEMKNSKEYNKALAQGESAEVLKELRNKELEDVKGAFDDLSVLNSYIEKFMKDDDEKKAFLKEYKTLLSNELAKIVASGGNDKQDILNDQISGVDSQINEITAAQAEKAASGSNSGNKAIEALKQQYLGLLENGKLDDAKKIYDKILVQSEEQKKSTEGTQAKIGELLKEKTALEKYIEKVSGTRQTDKIMDKIKEVKNKLEEITNQIIGLKALLPSNVKQLLQSYEDNKASLLKCLEKGDIAGAAQALDAMKKAGASVPDNMKDLLTDKNTQNAAVKALLDLIKASSANNDPAKSMELTQLLNDVNKTFEDVAKSPAEKNMEEVYKQLDQMDGKHLQETKDKILQLEQQRDKLKDSLFAVIGSENTGATEKILGDLNDVVKKLSVDKKELLFIKLDMLKDLNEQNKNKQEMLQSLAAVKKDIIGSLGDAEASQYTDDEIKSLKALSTELAAPGSGIAPMQVENVIFRGKYVKLSVPLIKKDGTLFIPIRAIFEVFGAKVWWSNDQNRQATIATDDKVISLKIGSDTAAVTDKQSKKEFKLDKCPELINGRTFAPLSFIAQNMGFEYQWLDDKTISIVMK